MDIGHILADLAFITFGLIAGAFAIKLWRTPPQLPRLDESVGDAIARGSMLPGKISIVGSSSMIVSLGLFGLFLDFEQSVKTHFMKDLLRTPLYLFFASTAFWMVIF